MSAESVMNSPHSTTHLCPAGALSGHADEVWAVTTCASDDGKDVWVVSASDDFSLNVWDLATHRVLHTLRDAHMGTARSVAAQYPLIVSGAYYGKVRVWDGTTGRLLKTFPRLKTFPHNGGDVEAVDTDGNVVVSGSADGRIKVWDIASGQQVQEMVDRSRPNLVGDGGAAHNGDLYAIKIVDLPREWQRQKRLLTTAISSFVPGVLASIVAEYTLFENAKVVLSGAEDGLIKVWHLASGQLLRTLQGHTDRVHSICVTERLQVVSASCDRTIRVWSLETGRMLRIMEGHRHWVSGVALCRVQDRECVVSVSRDQTLRLWDLDTGMELEQHDESTRLLDICTHGNTVITARSNPALSV